MAIPIKNLPMFSRGDDVGEILSNHFEFENGDIVLIASTIVSKSEGRVVRLSDVHPTPRAKEIASQIDKRPEFVQIVLDESDEILLEKPFLLVCRKGHICVNAGVDESNVEEGYALLLPSDPDKSAERIRDRIMELTHKEVGVVITDTCGRPFRVGQCGVAIGCSGVSSVVDWRGRRDCYGKELRVTREVVADELAGFANILMGEGNWRIPAVVVRGLSHLMGDGKAVDIFRPKKEDIIRDILHRQS